MSPIHARRFKFGRGRGEPRKAIGEREESERQEESESEEESERDRRCVRDANANTNNNGAHGWQTIPMTPNRNISAQGRPFPSQKLGVHYVDLQAIRALPLPPVATPALLAPAFLREIYKAHTRTDTRAA